MLEAKEYYENVHAGKIAGSLIHSSLDAVSPGDKAVARDFLHGLFS